MTYTLHVISIAFLVGFFGDLLLQLGVSQHLGNWGLATYFEKHGHFESMFIAGGMMTFFYATFHYILGQKFTYWGLAVYGIVWDLAFRYFRLFPSLDGYYRYFNYFWSAFWIAIPMMMPLAIADFVKENA